MTMSPPSHAARSTSAAAADSSRFMKPFPGFGVHAGTVARQCDGPITGYDETVTVGLGLSGLRLFPAKVARGELAALKADHGLSEDD